MVYKKYFSVVRVRIVLPLLTHHIGSPGVPPRSQAPGPPVLLNP